MSPRVSVDSGWMVGNSEVMFSLTVRATVNQRVDGQPAGTQFIRLLLRRLWRLE